MHLATGGGIGSRGLFANEQNVKNVTRALPAQQFDSVEANVKVYLLRADLTFSGHAFRSSKNTFLASAVKHMEMRRLDVMARCRPCKRTWG